MEAEAARSSSRSIQVLSIVVSVMPYELITRVAGPHRRRRRRNSSTYQASEPTTTMRRESRRSPVFSRWSRTPRTTAGTNSA